MLNELLNSVQRRIVAFVEQADKEAILSDQAQMELSQLTQLGLASIFRASREENIVIIQTLAFFHWHCSLVSSIKEHHEAALMYFVLLSKLNPDRVPEVLKQAVQQHAANLSSRGTSIGAVLAGFSETAVVADIDEAIHRARSKIAANPRQGYSRATALSGLAEYLQMKFHTTNELSHLNEAIQARREAIASLPPEHELLSGSQYNLGNVLRIRFERIGRRADLDEAISVQTEAAEATPVGHPYRASRHSNLSAAYLLRYQEYDEPDDLNRAILQSEIAIAIDHPGLSKSLQTLANCLLMRFEESKNEDDLDAIIKIQRRALSLSADESADKANQMANLGASLREKFKINGISGYIDDAICLGRNAIRETQENAPSRAPKEHMLAEAYATRFEAYAVERDARMTIETWRRVVDEKNATTPLRMQAARDCGNFAANVRNDWATALWAYAEVVKLLQLLAWRANNRVDQIKWLGIWGGMPSRAASIALSAGKPLKAIALLEQGHGILWSQLLNFRTDFESLGVPHELASQLREIGSQLESNL
jgi:hypothetical protein